MIIMEKGIWAKHTISLRRDLLGMLTEVAFTSGFIGVGFLVAWLFFVGR